MLDLPLPGQFARFADGFAPRVLLTVDTEEEFDWDSEFSKTEHGLDHVRQLGRFQEFCENLGISPVYLVDWPITQSAMAQDVLGDACARGKAEIGIQLHPWVNPPFEEEINAHNSYAGNLPTDLEREKLLRLRDAITENFKCAPQIYRAGRYGLGPSSAKLLKQAGVAVDTSVRSGFDYSPGHGPDYSRHPLRPWWVGEEQRLLELPVTTVFWGMLRQQAKSIYPMVARSRLGPALLAKLGLLERIAMTPEGVSIEEALRGVDIAVDDGLPVIVLSFHSPSLAPGYTPYVKSEGDVDGLYEWFRQVIGYLGQRGVKPTTVAEIMANAVI
ncbi:polysaccharide deacetylase family protein [Erythrobacter sp. SDW2]|uniref:polysaccharide deacetylase family protein n=1 Tax=Erythrobacter sp. SDW2 TaxID=2907154 RepID=UPI001F2618FD|nr:polysaccharide deacetylase family protein [Erythrobacter sp. SDW2]UIP06250.1 polysaccharide deacetylase family protein [Erythrobacter sp. SDW2]